MEQKNTSVILYPTDKEIIGRIQAEFDKTQSEAIRHALRGFENLRVLKDTQKAFRNGVISRQTALDKFNEFLGTP